MRSHLAHFHRYENIIAGANHHKAQMDGERYPVHPHTSNISQVDFFHPYKQNLIETPLLNGAFR